MVQLPASQERAATDLLKGALILTITGVGYQWINLLVPSREHTKKMRQLDVQLMRLAQPFMKILVVLTGILLTLKTLNFNIANMLAGISIGGIGFALASQDTIKNFFGTLTICIDQPFVIGDTIVTDNIKGTVEEIGLRATRIRTGHQSTIYVPNAKLIDTPVDNHGIINYQYFDVHIAVASDTIPTLSEEFMEGLSKIAIRTTHFKEDKHTVYLEKIQNTTLKILLRVYFAVNNQYGSLQCKHEVLSEITDLATKLGIDLVSLT